MNLGFASTWVSGLPRSTAIDTPFCTIRKSHVTWNFAVPVPHSEETRRCTLLFLCTLGKYQNGTSYTRVSAHHIHDNWDAHAPLWVSFSKGLWAKNVLSPSKAAFLPSVEVENNICNFRWRPSPYPYPNPVFTSLKIPYLNRNHRRQLFIQQKVQSKVFPRRVLSAGMWWVKKRTLKTNIKEMNEKTKRKKNNIEKRL